MTTTFSVPQGEEKVTIELTVKEAMALTGVRFNNNPEVLPNAKKKLIKKLEQKKELH